LSDDDLASVRAAYAELVNRTASIRALRSGGKSRVKFGPTGTAKILFAIRPNSMIPWDVPMRSKFQFDDTAGDYVNYLKFVRKTIEELNDTCIRKGYHLSELPHLLGRPKSSLTKLIDEYHWVTVSRECPAPTSQELKEWGKWW